MHGHQGTEGTGPGRGRRHRRMSTRPRPAGGAASLPPHPHPHRAREPGGAAAPLPSRVSGESGGQPEVRRHVPPPLVPPRDLHRVGRSCLPPAVPHIPDSTGGPSIIPTNRRRLDLDPPRRPAGQRAPEAQIRPRRLSSQPLRAGREWGRSPARAAHRTPGRAVPLRAMTRRSPHRGRSTKGPGGRWSVYRRAWAWRTLPRNPSVSPLPVPGGSPDRRARPQQPYGHSGRRPLPAPISPCRGGSRRIQEEASLFVSSTALIILHGEVQVRFDLHADPAVRAVAVVQRIPHRLLKNLCRKLRAAPADPEINRRTRPNVLFEGYYLDLISCVSLHRPDPDTHYRQSMRAYRRRSRDPASPVAEVGPETRLALWLNCSGCNSPAVVHAWGGDPAVLWLPASDDADLAIERPASQNASRNQGSTAPQ